MPVQLRDTSVYLGDIHGTRLSHLEDALRALAIAPSALLCTMDLDQVLSVQDLVDLEKRYLGSGRPAVLVPGNHEAALIHRIGIDSSTYRDKQQDTTILALIEAIDLPHFGALRAFVQEKLAIEGGEPLALGGKDGAAGLLIHGALAGKQEKYLHEFPPELQDHVRRRSDLWLRLEDRSHLAANFRTMEERGIEVMLRGHDHYVALRSQAEGRGLCSHQLVINMVSAAGLEYRTERPRDGDGCDDLALADAERLGRAREARALYWHSLVPDSRYVVNFGPYYLGHFGLVRAATAERTLALAFCQTDVSFYTAEDRKRRLKPFSLAEQARSGRSFYDLFPRRHPSD
jgi:hypothetical protein